VTLQPADADAHINLGVCLRHEGKVEEAIQEYQKALAIAPTKPKAYYNLGNALVQQNRIAEALEAYAKELRQYPDEVDACQNLAWLLATTADAALRNGSQAEILAQHASTLAHDANPTILRTLAAAQAEANHFDNAIATARRAAQMAQIQGNTPLAELLERDAAGYQAGRSLR